MPRRLARGICPIILFCAASCGPPKTPGADASKCQPFAAYRGLPQGESRVRARVWVEDLTSPELELDGICMILDDRWMLPLERVEPHVTKWEGQFDRTHPHHLLLLSYAVGYIDGLRFSGPVKSHHPIGLQNDEDIDLAAWIEPGGDAETFTGRSLLAQGPRILWREERGARAGAGASGAAWRPTKPWVLKAEEVLSAMGPALRACYRDGLARHPTLEGSVRIAIEVAADGSVGSVKPTAVSVFDDGVLDCFARRIGGATFSPPEKGPTTIVFPMTFVRDE